MLLSNSAWAVKIGLGLSHDKHILVPMRLSDGFMLELTLKPTGSGFADNRAGDTKIITERFSNMGIGLFGMIAAKHSMEYYYGLRIFRYECSKEKIVAKDIDRRKVNGLTIGMLGAVRYYFNSFFSVSFEAGVETGGGEDETMGLKLSSHKIAHYDSGNFSNTAVKTRILARVMF